MIVSRPRVDGSLATATCTAGEAVGDLVYISGPRVGSDYTVRKADISDYTKMPAVAIITSKLSATQAVIQFEGETGLYSGLSPGRLYWVSDSGIPTSTVPPISSGQRKYHQSIGIATDSDRIRLEFNKNLITRVG